MNEEVQFANHIGRSAQQAQFEWGPGYRKQNDFQISALEHVSVDQLERAMVQVSNWRRYYSSWSDGDKHEAEYLAGLKVKRYYLLRTPLNLTEAISSVCEAFLLWNGERMVEEFLPDTDIPDSINPSASGNLLVKIRRRLQAFLDVQHRIRADA